MRARALALALVGMGLLVWPASSWAQVASDDSASGDDAASTWVERAQEAYAQLRLDEAEELLGRALSISERAESSIKVRTATFVLAAQLARARGDETVSDAWLDRALEASPDLELEAADYPPPFLVALERRRSIVRDGLERQVVQDRVRVPTTVLPPASDPLAVADTLTPSDPDASPTTSDPWLWLGLGAGVLVLAGGGIVLGVVLSEPAAGFDVRGSIAP